MTCTSGTKIAPALNNGGAIPFHGRIMRLQYPKGTTVASHNEVVSTCGTVGFQLFQLHQEKMAQGHQLPLRMQSERVDWAV